MNIADLKAEFPKQDISWRAQSLTRDGTKAMALAYIDARDVMDRLDQVCGPAGWQDSYRETTSGRVIATISIKIGDEWIAKSDGAGDTAVEGEKGALSDAFKRAAVKWGIGRYLYALEAVWVPCETYESGGKKHWSRWKADPWSCVRGNGPSKDASRELYERLSTANRAIDSEERFNAFWSHKATIDARAGLPVDWQGKLDDEKNDKAAELAEKAERGYVAPNFDDLPQDTRDALDNMSAG